MTDRQTIDITPTWTGLLPGMLRILEDASQPEGAKQPLREELTRLAKHVDDLNKRSKTELDFKAWLVSLARDIANGDDTVIERAENIIEMFDSEEDDQ